MISIFKDFALDFDVGDLGEDSPKSTEPDPTNASIQSSVPTASVITSEPSFSPTVLVLASSAPNVTTFLPKESSASRIHTSVNSTATLPPRGLAKNYNGLSKRLTSFEAAQDPAEVGTLVNVATESWVNILSQPPRVPLDQCATFAYLQEHYDPPSTRLYVVDSGANIESDVSLWNFLHLTKLTYRLQQYKYLDHSGQLKWIFAGATESDRMEVKEDVSGHGSCVLSRGAGVFGASPNTAVTIVKSRVTLSSMLDAFERVIDDVYDWGLAGRSIINLSTVFKKNQNPPSPLPPNWDPVDHASQWQDWQSLLNGPLRPTNRYWPFLIAVKEMTAAGIVLVSASGNTGGALDGRIDSIPALFNTPDFPTPMITVAHTKLDGTSNDGAQYLPPPPPSPWYKTTLDIWALGTDIICPDKSPNLGYVYGTGSSFG